MAFVCRTCARVNPSEARYCYYDGVALPGAAHQDGPIAVGAQPFRHPFVFPSGRACHNFDELVLACDADWAEVRQMLREGYLEQFLGGLGRVDLALAARQAAGGGGDPDRALNDFLTKLPVSQRELPRLAAAPLDVNLGQLSRADERTFVLHLENRGSGLLYGSVVCEDTPWLALGEAPGAPQKVFQVPPSAGSLTLPVHVHGKGLRAGNAPLEGKIVVESNGGNLTVVVRAEVPVKPFPDGVLAGARTPRQIAEKAKVAPREAAPLFETGAVARWYEANGWTYPVQGPASQGLGAVQQFFEALGLVTPPRVEISERTVELVGDPGAALAHVLVLRTVEKRPVFAHATSTVPWLTAGPVALGGRSARIPLLIASVPDAPGQRLQGKVHVTANGNQRFTVEVGLAVSGSIARRAGPGLSERGPAPPSVVDYAETLAPPAGPAGFHGRTAGFPPAPLAPPLPRGQGSGVRGQGGRAGYFMAPDIYPLTPEGVVPVDVLPVEAVTAEPEPEVASGPGGWLSPPRQDVQDMPPPPRGEGGGGGRALYHLAPLGLMALVLVVLVLHDLLVAPGGPPEEEIVDDDPGPVRVDPAPLIAIRWHDPEKCRNRVTSLDEALPEPSMRFGLVMLGEKDPQNPTRLKRLMWDEWGRTNNTCVRVDDKDFLFGHARIPAVKARPPLPSLEMRGHWVEMEAPLGKDETGRAREGARSVWELDDSRVRITQVAEVVPGQVIEMPDGSQVRRLDTCLVRYALENKDSTPHEVGLRFLLDTFIGANDGVPFTIPGTTGLVDTDMSFNARRDVPEYIQALENSDLLHPGTVAHVQFKVGGALESPDRVLLGGYPDAPLRHLRDKDTGRLQYPEVRGWYTLWRVPLVPIRELFDRRDEIDKTPEMIVEPDSAVTMYWNVRTLAPGARREVGFTYGLGHVASSEGKGRLLLSVPNSIRRDSEFTLTALVNEPVKGEKLTLALPRKGFRLLDGTPEQEVPAVPPGSARHISTVTWRIHAGGTGRYLLRVHSSTGVAQKQPLRVTSPPPTKGILD